MQSPVTTWVEKSDNMEHFYRGIQGWFNYESIYDRAVAQSPDPAHFVEIGSWRGKSTVYLAVVIHNSGKQIRLDCVDTWRGSPDEDVHQQDPAVINDTLYQEFLKNTETVRHIVNPVRMASVDAAKLYQDQSLDFVLIDAGHSYTDVSADIQAWLPKIRSGGLLAGDDYAWPGVRQAVDELLPRRNILQTIGCWVHAVG